MEIQTVLNKVAGFYPDYRVYGPYGSNDGRKRLTFREVDEGGMIRKAGSKSFSMAWSRALMIAKLDRLLSEDEEVDHINEDHTDDSVDNLQVLSYEEHKQKSGRENGARQNRRTLEVCPVCEKEFMCRGDSKRKALSLNRQPCCSRVCGSKYGRSHSK